MAPLPPVRKRRDYADIGKDDLVSALFHDRLAGTPDAMQPAALARDAMAELAAADAAALKDATGLTVFKDAAGQWRWVARSTTAYRDRDQEIISLKALEEDAARMTASGQYGPLRWWHVGDPDPANEQAPWGDGYDLGTCDFSTVIGRCAIESGTFKSAEIAQWVAEHAGEFELSPGFFHAARDRDADGVFHRIHRFERSLVPVRFGRASNLFTGLIVQEAE